MENDYYLKIGRATELKSFKERIVFRLFEIFPGFLAWSVLFLAIFLSWQRPLWIALFIIFFSIFWFLRTIYFSFHLWSGYRIMKRNEKINWIEKLNNLPATRYPLPTIKDWRDIYHLIVIPMYKEPPEVVRDTFLALEKADYPKDKMIVVLACEERARKVSEKTAEKIGREFGPKFFKFLATWHPVNLPGEIAGKGSNETWAAKKAKELIVDELNPVRGCKDKKKIQNPQTSNGVKLPYKNIIFSSFDADTCIFPKYFSCLTYYYLTSKKPFKTSFQPIPLYINNIWQVPAISRVFSFSSSFWHTMNQERPEKLITFSSHSMSFKALVDVGFRQTNVVSDDSRIFWQCFLKYDGDYRVQPLYYPLSMDANVAKSFFKTMINIYKQQRRWAYGVGDIPYFLFGFLKNKKIPLLKKISLGFELIEGHLSWATASILIFLLGWLPLILGGAEFSHTLISYNLPKMISRVMTLAMLGLIGSMYLSFLLLPPKPPEYGRFKYLILAFSWLLVPIIMIFFGAFPALDAQTRWLLGKYMSFWPTEKVRK